NRNSAPLSYVSVATLRIQLSANGEPARYENIDIPRATQPKFEPLPRSPAPGEKRDLDLSNFFTNDGLLGDTDHNLIPDRLDVVLVPAGEGTARAIDLAARLGLESTGITLPVAKSVEAIVRPEDDRPLAL